MTAAPMLQRKHPEAYAAAVHLIEHGVPIFLAKKDPDWPNGGHDNSGYWFPPEWQKTEPDLSVLRKWTPEYALGAVMGYTVDGLDRDPRNGGDLPQVATPRSYGRANTPSGGTHDLIAALGVRSRDGVLPGVDVKAGLDGLGRGFLFLAPTQKINKVTKEIGQYEWVEMPDLSDLMLGDDDSGKVLAEMVNSGRSVAVRASYDGPEYDELPADQKAAADQYVEAKIFDWKVKLAEASTWSDGERDEKGRGWEALSRDAAWTVAMTAVCPWTPLTEADAESVFDDLLPQVIAADRKCAGKWYDGILEKAAAQTIEQPPWWSSVFFDQTDTLRHIRDAAWSRLCSPSGVLALMLGRVLAEVPPSVVLPPVIGSAASLNLGIAIKSGSGGGKSTSVSVSAELLGMVGMDQESQIERGVGSGEGLIDQFLQVEMVENAKGEMKPSNRQILADDPRCIVVCDEIEQMEAVGVGRSGSTLNSILRSALTGDALRTTNSRAGGRTRSVPKRTYRAVVILGVQPGRSDILLNEREVSTGTPQRFLWCDAADPSRPKDERPVWPGPLDWEPPEEWPETVWYPEHIRDEVITQREAFLDGKVQATEGHSTLTRLKVAFALGVLHGETKISDQWWSLAGELLNASRQIQADCYAVLSESADKREISRETRRAKAVAHATEIVGETRLARAAESVVGKLKKSPGAEFTWEKVKPAFRLRDGLEKEEILAEVRRTPGVKISEYEAQGRTAFKLKWEDPDA